MNPERAMVIVAHPDDAEFLAGGSVVLWTQNSTAVTYVVVTNGDKGTDDPNLTSAELAVIREDEQRHAAQRLGVTEVFFLGYPDSMLQPTLDVRRDIVRMIRRHRPNVVVTFDPTNRFIAENYMNHPDHRAAGDAALDAVFPAARDRLTFPELFTEEGLAPHKVEEVWMGAPHEPNHWVNIEPVLQDKIEALRQHHSQLDDMPLEQFIPEMAKMVAQGSDYTYAESFRRMVLT
jgi:LmbE family N-acetylglucosaminyl deacetylase